MKKEIDFLELNVSLPRLHRFAYSLTRNNDAACDLVQDTVERALRKAHLFDGSNLSAWLTTICRRIFLNDSRRNKPWRGIASIDDAPANHLSVDASQDTHIHFKSVVACFNLLNPLDKEIIGLIGVDGLSYRQAAAAQKAPIGTIRSRLSRARARLAEAVASGSTGRRSGRPSAGVFHDLLPA